MAVAAMLERGSRGYVAVPYGLEGLSSGSSASVCVPVAASILAESFPELEISFESRPEACLEAVAEGRSTIAVIPEEEFRLAYPEADCEPLEGIMPAASQGIIAVLCGADSCRARGWASSFNHMPTRIEAGAERGIMKLMGAGPSTPVGISGEMEDMFVRIRAVSSIRGGLRSADEYVQADYVMDDLLGIAEYLDGKRDEVIRGRHAHKR